MTDASGFSAGSPAGSPAGIPAGLAPEARAFRESLNGPFAEHVAIIMDGNGRWAQGRGWLRVRGHKEGMESVRHITTAAAELGVKSLTLYAFSRENWKRPDLEVRALMRLLRFFVRRERKTMMDNGIRLLAIGRMDDLPRFARRALEDTIALTAGNTKMTLRLALSYGGRTEIADAALAMSRDIASGKLKEADVGEETLRGYLYDPSTPDPDLVIRTAGEMRLSNFLLWQASYAEFYVTDDCWPDFRREQFEAALHAYAGRKRKFGGLPPELDAPVGTDALGQGPGAAERPNRGAQSA